MGKNTNGWGNAFWPPWCGDHPAAVPGKLQPACSSWWTREDGEEPGQPALDLVYRTFRGFSMGPFMKQKNIYIYLDAQASETCKSLVCCLKWCALLFVCLNYNVHVCEHWVCKLLNIWYLNICDLVFTVSVYCRLIISTHTVSKVITLFKVCLVLYLLIFG